MILAARIAALSVVLFCISAATALAENVSFQADGVTITGQMARPNGPGPFPAVLVLHGCEGPGALESSTIGDLAGAGYVALAINTLQPQGLSNACGAGATPVHNAAQYATAALQWLSQQTYVVGNRLGIVGYSMGAMAALDVINPPGGPPPSIPGLRAVVAYYPSCSAHNTDINVPLLILDGSADDWIPPGPCQALAQNAHAAGKPVQIVTYPGATHAFNQPERRGSRTVNGHTLTYDPQATADADARMKAFFQLHLH